jgi:hypothetical protein
MKNFIVACLSASLYTAADCWLLAWAVCHERGAWPGYLLAAVASVVCVARLISRWPQKHRRTRRRGIGDNQTPRGQ